MANKRMTDTITITDQRITVLVEGEEKLIAPGTYNISSSTGGKVYISKPGDADNKYPLHRGRRDFELLVLKGHQGGCGGTQT